MFKGFLFVTVEGHAIGGLDGGVEGAVGGGEGGVEEVVVGVVHLGDGGAWVLGSCIEHSLGCSLDRLTLGIFVWSREVWPNEVVVDHAS